MFAKITLGQWSGQHSEFHGKWLTAAHLSPSKLREMGTARPYFLGKLPNQPLTGMGPLTCSDTLCNRRTDSFRQRERK